MNKQILISLSVIGAVAAIAIGGTVAYFSDVETSTGNTITAGTIDIQVSPSATAPFENPLKSILTTIPDAKPSVWFTRVVRIHNVGGNPAKVWKHIPLTSIVTDGGIINEPECEAQGGTWSIDGCTGGTETKDIDTQIHYEVWLDNDVNGEVSTPDIKLTPDGATLRSIASTWIYLAELPQSHTRQILERYHLKPSADSNKYQGDKVSFTIEFYGEQLGGPGKPSL